ncbi:MAG: TRAP transporter substrate-binding protein [Chloroflexota bacterium]
MSNQNETVRLSRRQLLKGIGVAAIGLGSAGFVAACQPAAAPATPAPAAATQAPAAAKPATGAKVLKLGHINAVSDPANQASVKFAELVAQKSQGRYEVKVYPASQLGDLAAQLDGVVSGSQEMFQTGWGALGSQMKDFDISGYPSLFRDQAHAWKLAASPVGQDMYERLRKERGLRPLSIDWLWPPRQIVSKRPIKSAADMKGLKMRVPEQKVWSESWKAMGVYVTPMAWGEIFTGLQQGIVEALEGPSTQLIPMKFTDVAKYVTITNHTKFLAHVITNDKWFSALSADDQKLFVDASKEAAVYGNKLAQDADTNFVSDLKKIGVTVINPDPDFFAPMKDLPAKFEADGLWSKGLYQKIQDLT